jgi:hypothetical protein
MDNETLMLFLVVCGGALLAGILNIAKKYFLGNKINEDMMTVGTMPDLLFQFPHRFLFLP